MNKKHLTGIASVATIALISTTAAWGADVDITGGSYKSEGKTLTLQSNADYQEIAITDGQAASINSDVSDGTLKIVVDRGSVPATTYSTIMLPANAEVDDENIVKAFLATTFERNGDDCTITAIEATSIEANKPYFIQVNTEANEDSRKKLHFKTRGANPITVTGGTDPNKSHSIKLSGTCFTLTGVYKTKTWASDSDFDYGFAAEEEGSIIKGQFVRIGEGATLYPARAFLTCDRHYLAKTETTSSESLPDVINVRFVDKNNQTLSIGKMNTKTGEIQMQDNYYDLKGRKLNAKPQNKIMYVNKKVIKH